MICDSPNLYAEWRLLSGGFPVLREDHETPPERLLQAVWLHQRLLRDKLRTLDGRPVRVLHPGFQSVEGGPDFRGAVIQFGDDAPCTGDIEVDLRTGGWRAHGHHQNPAFANVILHVVWEGEPPCKGAPPPLVIRDFLDARIGELSLWLSGESASQFPEEARGKCASALKKLSGPELAELLRQAGRVRLRSKANLFQARARQAGWEQALWEGLARGLGYKHNVWPMQRLAELRQRWYASSAPVAQLQARLFGISGMLPAELPRTHAESDAYVRRVWDLWWRERDAFSDCLLPKMVWRLHGLRPANHPQRRLALASHWCAPGKLSGKIEKWVASEIPRQALPGSLLEILQVQTDDFWSRHCTFRSAPLKQAQPLIGATRVTDLAVNVVLPWLWARAVEGGNSAVQNRIEERYDQWPAAEDNSVLRLARQRLLNGASPRTLASASEQQGLIQIVRDFCDHTNAVCEGCQFPELAERGVGVLAPI